MPQVASESNVSTQATALRARTAGKPQRRQPEPFAQLLPEPNSAPTPAGRSAPQRSKPAAKEHSATPAAQPQKDPRATAETETKPAAQADGTAAEAKGEAKADADIKPSADIGPGSDADSMIDAAIEAIVETTPPDADLAAAVATLVPTVNAAAPATVAPLADTMTATALVQEAADALPAPAPDASQDAKPVTAGTAIGEGKAAPDQSDGLEPEAVREPATALVAKPQAPAKSQLTPSDAIKAPTLASAEQTFAGQAKVEPATFAPSADDAAGADKPAVEREGPEQAASTKPAARTAGRTPAAQLATIDMRGPDAKGGPTLDFATTALQPASPAHMAAQATHTTPAPVQQAAPTAPVPVPLGGIAVVIAANVQGGRNQFEIRLDPPELGRIDVRLHFDSKGYVTSHLVVDRAETLDLLRRDAADLERSLQQAGLKTSDGGLQFTLRDQTPGGDGTGREQGRTAHVVVHDNEPAPELVMRGYLRAGEGAGLDIRI